MRRGEVWTVAGAGDYAGKLRPVVIVQDDSFEGRVRLWCVHSRAIRPKHLCSGFTSSQILAMGFAPPAA
jgi:mRNA-degrading endonuclease toxin of MazEF toxin-antitoxin module